MGIEITITKALAKDIEAQLAQPHQEGSIVFDFGKHVRECGRKKIAILDSTITKEILKICELAKKHQGTCDKDHSTDRTLAAVADDGEHNGDCVEDDTKKPLLKRLFTKKPSNTKLLTKNDYPKITFSSFESAADFCDALADKKVWILNSLYLWMGSSKIYKEIAHLLRNSEEVLVP